MFIIAPSLKRISVLAGLALMTACTELPSRTSGAPVVSVHFVDTQPATSISSDDAEYEVTDNCAIMRPGREVTQRLRLAANDPGGLESIGLRVFFEGDVEVGAYAPSDATTTISRSGGNTIVEAVIPPRTDGLVYVSALFPITVRPRRTPVAVRGFARDLEGNYTETQQFDLRAANEGVICRGAPPPEG